jgi:hypothetical protein
LVLFAQAKKNNKIYDAKKLLSEAMAFPHLPDRRQTGLGMTVTSEAM